MNQNSGLQLTSGHLKEIAVLVSNIGDPEILIERILHLVRRQLLADRVALFGSTPDGGDRTAWGHGRQW